MKYLRLFAIVTAIFVLTSCSSSSIVSPAYTTLANSMSTAKAGVISNVSYNTYADKENDDSEIPDTYTKGKAIGKPGNVGIGEIYKTLGIKNSVEDVKDIFYYAKKYFAITSGNCYTSSDLKLWKKIKLPVRVSSIHALGGDDKHVFIIADRLYLSHDGTHWQRTGEDVVEKSGGHISYYGFIKGLLVIRKPGLKESKPVRFNDYKIIYLPNEQGETIESDGKKILGKFNYIAGGKITISDNGEQWIDTGIKIPEYDEEYGIYFRMVNYKENTYLILNKDVYQIMEINGKFKVSKLSSTGEMSRNILEIKKNYNNRHQYEMYYGGLVTYGYIPFEWRDFEGVKKDFTDLLLLNYYIRLSHQVVANDRIFKLGKNGMILYSQIDFSKKNDWKWCGLYSRKPITSKELKDSRIRGKLGVGCIKNLFIFLLKDEKEFDEFNKIVYSADGSKWNVLKSDDFTPELHWASDRYNHYIYQYKYQFTHGEYKLENPRIFEEELLVNNKYLKFICNYKYSKSKGLVFDKRKLYEFPGIPRDTEDIKFLGINGGTMSIEAALQTDIVKNLGIDRNYPEVLDIAFGAGYYFVLTKDKQIYRSKDFIDWEKFSFPVTVDKVKYFSGDQKGIIVIDNEAIYWSENGENWAKVLSVKAGCNVLENEYAYANGTICVIDNNVSKIRKANTSEITLVRLPGSVYRDIETDGQYFGIALQETKWASSENDLLYISMDGIQWIKTGITAGGSDYEVGTFKMQRVDGKNYIESQRNGCMSETWINQLIKLENGYSYKQLYNFEDYFGELKVMNEKIENQKIIYALSIAGGVRFLNPMVSTKGKTLNDIYIVDNFCNQHQSVTYINNMFFFYGNYGYISKTEDVSGWDWCGLYGRDPLSLKELADVNIGGILGVREDNGVLWYTNEKFALDSYGVSGNDILMSVEDGVWLQVGRDKERVYIEDGKLNR